LSSRISHSRTELTPSGTNLCDDRQRSARRLLAKALRASRRREDGITLTFRPPQQVQTKCLCWGTSTKIMVSSLSLPQLLATLFSCRLLHIRPQKLGMSAPVSTGSVTRTLVPQMGSAKPWPAFDAFGPVR